MSERCHRCALDQALQELVAELRAAFQRGAAAADRAMSDFGARLRQARERRGITLRDIAAHTKFSIAALEALERNDASRLPGGIFARSFVRSYASEVGLDPEATVREFLERFDVEPRCR